MCVATDTRPEKAAHRWPPRVSIALASVGAVVVFGAVVLASQLGRPYTSSGDTAFIELGVRQAIRHGNAIGVYSRYGWHHPGPALFYLLAPLYALSGESS